MHGYLSVGVTLFHKYLSNVKVLEVCEDKIKADTGSRGVLDFAFYDFGKVLFFEKSHSGKSFESYKKYLEFCDEEKRLKIIEEEKAEQEREARRLLQIKESEKQKQLELERQRHTNDEKKKKEQQNNPTTRNIVATSGNFSPWSNSIDLSSLMEEFFPTRETLLKIKKDHENKIREIIERRKIEYLVHFTRIDNLSSILRNGLIPVSIQHKMKIPSVHNDEQRIDSKLDCTSCSVTFPNYKLFYTFREYKFPGTKWAIIILNKDVLFSPFNISYYCHTNAAGVFPRVSSVKELCIANAFESMFCESITTKTNKSIQRSSLQINDCITTDPQAEILISDVIDAKHIACVYFQNQRDIDEYIKKNGQELLNLYDYQVIPGFFDARKDYIFWKKE